MSPEEIGHAAAYEAYRTWIHNRFMYQHFHDDIERQREALTGLAVAEGDQKFLNRSPESDFMSISFEITEFPIHPRRSVCAIDFNRSRSSYRILYLLPGRLLFRDQGFVAEYHIQTRNEEYRSRSHTRVDDPYAYDDELLYPHSSGRSRSRHRSRHHSMSRHRSLSRPRSYSQMGYSGSGYGGSAYGGSAYGGSSYSPPPSAVYPPTPYPAGSYAGSVGSSFGNGIPIPGSSYGVPMSAGSSYGGGVLSSSYGAGGLSSSYGAGGLNSSYGAGGMLSSSPYTSQFPVTYQSGVPMDYTRTRSASFSYPQQYYPQPYVQQPYMPGVATTANTMPGGGQLVIIQKPSKRRKHRRASSPDMEYDKYSSRSSRR
jgi:hypothetical protein